MNLLALYEKVFSALVGGGLRGIIDAAYAVLGQPISLHDSAFNLLAAAPMEKIGDVYWDSCLDTGVYPREIVMAFYDQGFMEAASKIREPYYVDWGGCAELPRIQGVVRLHDVVEGYLAVFCPKEIYTPEYAEATKLLVNACAIEMEHNQRRNLSESPLLKVFMHDLVRGQLNTKEKLAVWGQRLPASFKGTFALHVVDTPVPDVKAVQKYLVAALERVQAEHIEMVDDNKLYVLLYALDGKSRLEPPEDVVNIFASLNSHMGMSDRFTDIMQFDACRKQAEAALELGKLLRSSDCVYAIGDYRFPAVMHSIVKYVDADDIHPPGIAILGEYDRNYGTEYLITLERYVLLSRNAKAAREALGIHRNTLLYRLQKIKEMLGISLEDGNTFAHYYISFYIANMLRIREGQRSGGG